MLHLRTPRSVLWIIQGRAYLTELVDVIQEAPFDPKSILPVSKPQKSIAKLMEVSATANKVFDFCLPVRYVSHHCSSVFALRVAPLLASTALFERSMLKRHHIPSSKKASFLLKLIN